MISVSHWRPAGRINMSPGSGCWDSRLFLSSYFLSNCPPCSSGWWNDSPENLSHLWCVDLVIRVLAHRTIQSFRLAFVEFAGSIWIRWLTLQLSGVSHWVRRLGPSRAVRSSLICPPLICRFGSRASVFFFFFMAALRICLPRSCAKALRFL